MSLYRRIAVYLPMSHVGGRGLLWGILQYSRSNDNWFFCDTPDKKPAQSNESTPPNGIIAMIESDEELAFLENQSIPWVGICIEKLYGDKCPVVCNQEEIGRKLANYFSNLGFQDVGYFSLKKAPSSQERLAGFRQISEAKGKNLHVFEGADASSESVPDGIIQWAKELSRPCAVMAYDDHAAKLLLEMSFRNGLRVPEDMAVAGVGNDVLICEFTRPPLSSLVMNYNEAGFCAAQMLDQQMNGQKPKHQTIVIEPSRIMIRQSTDILAIRDPEVAFAVRFIRDRSHQPLQVSDVMEHVNSSQPTLGNRFKKFLGHTISEEIASSRACRIGQMLCETDMTVGQIALAMGYASDKHLARIFRRFTGMTPTQYRRRHTKKEMG